MARLERMTPRLREHYLDMACPTFDTSPWVVGAPLTQRKVALISTAGLHRRDDRPFALGASDYRLIPADTPAADLVMSHMSTNYDRTGSTGNRPRSGCVRLAVRRSGHPPSPDRRDPGRARPGRVRGSVLLHRRRTLLGQRSHGVHRRRVSPAWAGLNVARPAARDATRLVAVRERGAHCYLQSTWRRRAR